MYRNYLYVPIRINYRCYSFPPNYGEATNNGTWEVKVDGVFSACLTNESVSITAPSLFIDRMAHPQGVEFATS